MILAASAFSYLAISFYFARNWFKFFKPSAKTTPGNLFLSLVILVIVMISWPLVIPIYFIASASSFIGKRLFSAKPTNTYFYPPISAVTLTVSTETIGEKI